MDIGVAYAKNGCQLVIQHFTKEHLPSNMQIKSTDADPRKEMDYIRQFGTLFPYGGNDRLEEPKFIGAQEMFYNGGCIWQLLIINKVQEENVVEV